MDAVGKRSHPALDGAALLALVSSLVLSGCAGLWIERRRVITGVGQGWIAEEWTRFKQVAQRRRACLMGWHPVCQQRLMIFLS